MNQFTFKEKFKNIYSLNKTLRFSLIPHQDTAEILDFHSYEFRDNFLKDRKIAQNYKKLKEILNELHQEFIKQAPLVIVCCGNRDIRFHYKERGENLYMICDVSASIENLLLLVEEKGLGACWVGAFDEKKVSQILNLASNLRPLALIPVGFSNETPQPPFRVKKEEAIEIIE